MKLREINFCIKKKRNVCLEITLRAAKAVATLK